MKVNGDKLLCTTPTNVRCEKIENVQLLCTFTHDEMTLVLHLFLFPSLCCESRPIMSKSHTHHRICNILKTRVLFADKRDKKHGEAFQRILFCITEVESQMNDISRL